jgi:succinate dehydrogenase flavin-adding protein (antitoxin of CptAB toxin-antitoxin module)
MKAQKLSSVNKLMDNFDNQLKNLLMSDLSAVKAKTNLVNNIQNSLNNRLNAA